MTDAIAWLQPEIADPAPAVAAQASPRRRYRPLVMQPLVEPGPVTCEAGIPVPVYDHFRDRYTDRAWREVAASFAAEGVAGRQLTEQVSQRLLGIPGGSQVWTSSNPSALTGMSLVATAGRTMQRRLAIEAAWSRPDHDGLRLAIQDTWVPASRQLVDAASMCANAMQQDPQVAWEHLRSSTAGRVFYIRRFGHIWAPHLARNISQLAADTGDALRGLIAREITWILGEQLARGNDIANPIVASRALREGLDQCHGHLNLTRRGSHYAGLPGLPTTAQMSADRLTAGAGHSLAWACADQAWAEARGIADDDRRPMLPGELTTAVRIAITQMAPGLGSSAWSTGLRWEEIPGQPGRILDLAVGEP